MLLAPLQKHMERKTSIHVDTRERADECQCGLLLEVQVLESEVCLDDAGSFHSGPQHVLLGGNVVCSCYPLKIIQITKTHTNTSLAL